MQSEPYSVEPNAATPNSPGEEETEAETPADAIEREVRAANQEGREVELSRAELASLGHGKRALSKVIRRFCLGCMGGNAAEVRRCTAPACALFPYRLGKNVFHANAKPGQWRIVPRNDFAKPRRSLLGYRHDLRCWSRLHNAYLHLSDRN